MEKETNNCDKFLKEQTEQTEKMKEEGTYEDFEKKIDERPEAEMKKLFPSMF